MSAPFTPSGRPAHSPGIDRHLERISVVVPSFNDARFLERAICSVLDQHDPHLELHVIDGGSQDHTLDLLAAYDNELASWTTAWDSGPAEAINLGLRRATGDLILILAADDVLLPGALHTLRCVADQRPDHRWFVGDTHALDEHDQPGPDHPLTRTFATTQRPLDHPAHALLDPAGPPPLSACAFRPAALELAGPFDPQKRHTYGPDLILRLLDQLEVPARLPVAFAGLRVPTAPLITKPNLEPDQADRSFVLHPQADADAPATTADLLERQRETLELFEAFADRLPPAQRFAVAQANADRRQLLAQLEAQGGPPAPLWRQALKNPWRLTDPVFRRHLLAGQPNAALESYPAA